MARLPPPSSCRRLRLRHRGRQRSSARQGPAHPQRVAILRRSGCASLTPNATARLPLRRRRKPSTRRGGRMERHGLRRPWATRASDAVGRLSPMAFLVGVTCPESLSTSSKLFDHSKNGRICFVHFLLCCTCILVLMLLSHQPHCRIVKCPDGRTQRLVPSETSGIETELLHGISNSVSDTAPRGMMCTSSTATPALSSKS